MINRKLMVCSYIVRLGVPTVGLVNAYPVGEAGKEGTMPRTTKQDAAPDMAAMFQAFQMFMQAQGVQTDPESETPATKRGTKPATKRGTKRGTSAKKLNAERKATTTKPDRRIARNVITCGAAWTALGADPTYEPRDPNAPARNAQLWALNVAGKLTLKA